ncbi:hypothetical protein AN478_01590 [Thiohalorhabdus denitrificans]|uniref:Polyisoprenoid-binding protein YceI n=1 Tax=Thiohalorhabdus denitrificans TaxID=381306 RepID=A0A0P9CWW7_9GAMM|nr:YceI family protein [Thiohalorhabdus denitrificans]KPV41310.1 hypothetical protein AN478_01590 [Thiohalorhabdus denitrificans]SCY22606.1 Polyisoprenoid-binding protein YceI [Thiohalorhabdus denitrificans]
MKKTLITGLFALGFAIPGAQAAEYKIDTEGQHAFIQFKIQHLGYSWLHGRFNDFSGHFTYDKENPDASEVVVNIDPASIDSNHAERDKHLRDEEFLHVDEYPEAKFESTGFEDHGDGTATLEGELTLRGETNPVTIDVEHVGHGEDPWGGYRRGFKGTTKLALEDYGIDYDLGPDAEEVYLTLSIEGVRQDD